MTILRNTIKLSLKSHHLPYTGPNGNGCKHAITSSKVNTNIWNNMLFIGFLKSANHTRPLLLYSYFINNIQNCIPLQYAPTFILYMCIFSTKSAKLKPTVTKSFLKQGARVFSMEFCMEEIQTQAIAN